MSNPLVCGNCGTPNRANAKFCIGCAGRLPGLAPAGGVAAQIPAMQVFERERPIAASRPEASPTSFWLHLGLVGLTMIFAFVAWCIYVLHGRPAPWSQRADATASQAAQAREPVRVLVPVPTPVPAPAAPPAPEPARTAAAEPPTPVASAPPPPDAVTQALALARRQAASAGQAATPAPPAQRQTAAAERTAPAASRPAPTRTASITRARRDTREPEDLLDYPVVVRRPGSQPDPGPPIAAGPGPQYSWTRPASPRVPDDLGPPIAAGPGPRYEARPEVRAPVSAVMPSGDSGPPIAVGPGPRYDYSTPSARER
ncbi:zinc ribbon domain-containing protein [Variovorax sp. YR216]|uniref:zinc ribbon domain-containing protein n=1 Tax=Variovorax sp. YR216 TaxID=1882828 RepID=UPI000894B0A1|nr:zinc ribbon domain-containing protein [Variovorax sp. YR216]SEB17283.1 hypothetical protein SAMN05444680_11178 [Variovorax sp. YR216]